jgi:putative solute:sodium symporter small subunit
MKPSSTHTSVNPDLSETQGAEKAKAYWATNLAVVGFLLTIWFTISYVVSMFAIDSVNSIKIGRLGLGFWFAQQGSILTFVLLVWLYALVMDFVDVKFQNRNP